METCNHSSQEENSGSVEKFSSIKPTDPQETPCEYLDSALNTPITNNLIAIETPAIQTNKNPDSNQGAQIKNSFEWRGQKYDLKPQLIQYAIIAAVTALGLYHLHTTYKKDPVTQTTQVVPDDRTKEILAWQQKEIQELEALKVPRTPELEVEEAAFKQELGDKILSGEPFDVAETLFEMERVSNRIRPEIISAGKNFFNRKVQWLQSQLKGGPYANNFKKVAERLTPKGVETITSSSASVSLALEVAPRTQNCDARTKTLTMATAALFPELKEKTYWQRFNDHVNLVVDLDGTKHIIDRNPRPIENDQRSNENAYALIPLMDVFKGYAGLPTPEHPVINPELAEDPRGDIATDNEIYYGFRFTGNLGNFGTRSELVQGLTSTGNGTSNTTQNSIVSLMEHRLKVSNMETISDAQLAYYYIRDGSLDLFEFPNLSVEAVKRVNEIAKKYKEIFTVRYADPFSWSDEVIDEILKIDKKVHISFQLGTRVNHYLIEKLIETNKPPYTYFEYHSQFVDESDVKLIDRAQRLRKLGKVKIMSCPTSQDAFNANFTVFEKMRGSQQTTNQCLDAAPHSVKDWEFMGAIPDYSKYKLGELVEEIGNRQGTVNIASRHKINGRLVDQTRERLKKATAALLEKDPVNGPNLVEQAKAQARR